MPVNLQAPNLTPQQVMDQVGGWSTNKDKIGKTQTLYVDSSKAGGVRGNTAHKTLVGKTNFGQEAERAKQSIHNWLGSLGLDEFEYQDIFESVLKDKQSYTGQDLYDAAEMAKGYLDVYENRDQSAPIPDPNRVYNTSLNKTVSVDATASVASTTLPANCSQSDVQELRTWLSQNPESPVAARPTGEGGWEFYFDTDGSASVEDRQNVLAALKQIDQSVGGNFSDRAGLVIRDVFVDMISANPDLVSQDEVLAGRDQIQGVDAFEQAAASAAYNKYGLAAGHLSNVLAESLDHGEPVSQSKAQNKTAPPSHVVSQNCTTEDVNQTVSWLKQHGEETICARQTGGGWEFYVDADGTSNQQDRWNVFEALGQIDNSLGTSCVDEAEADFDILDDDDKAEAFEGFEGIKANHLAEVLIVPWD